MRALLIVMLVVACKGSSPSSSGSAAAKVVAQPGDIALVGASIWTMQATDEKAGPLFDHVVLIRGEKIAAVAPQSSVDLAAATQVDLAGFWIVPGLADMHVHTQLDTSFNLYLLNGVTTVRDLFGSPQHVKWRDEIASGKRAGPTVITAGPIIDGEPPTWPGSDVVTTPEAARETVKRQKAAGYDVLKVYNHLKADVYTALVDEAKQQKLFVMGHVPDAVGVAGVLAAGQRTIEHLDGFVPFKGPVNVDPAIVAATAKSETWNSPTLVVTARFALLDTPEILASLTGMQYVLPTQRAQWDPKHDFRLKAWTAETYAQLRERNVLRDKLVRDLVAAGGKFVLGTDTGNPYVIPGFAVHDELALLVRAGVTRYQALRMATAAPAEMLATPGAFGTIQPGARADLLVVAADPLVTLATLARPTYVYVRGKQHAATALLAQAEKDAEDKDPLADLPPLPTEGEKFVGGTYEVKLNGATIGVERAELSKLSTGTKQVRGQASFTAPMKFVINYRSVPDKLEQWTTDLATDGITAIRAGTKVTATPHGPDGKALELVVDAKALIAPQTIGPFFWQAALLADLKVGGKRTLPTAELVTEGAPKLVPGTYEYTRVADADGRIAYTLAGMHDKMAMKGRFLVDKDGAPYLVEITIPWGTFLMTRIE